MPPRHAFWTILVDDQPTAFRAHDAADLLATLNRLKEKHPSAVMKWFERGQLWNSREEARQMTAGRGERRGERPRTPGRDSTGPGAPRREATPPDAPRDEPPRDGRWRPGGEHRDPRQKYRDAKKAKWQRFKQNVRSRWESRRDDDQGRPRGPASDAPPQQDRRSEARREDTRPREQRRPDYRRFDERPDQRRDRQPWERRRETRPPPYSGNTPPRGDGPPSRWGSASADRKPWASKPHGPRPKGKPFGPKGTSFGAKSKPFGAKSKPFGAKGKSFGPKDRSFGPKGPRGPRRPPDRRPPKRRDDE